MQWGELPASVAFIRSGQVQTRFQGSMDRHRSYALFDSYFRWWDGEKRQLRFDQLIKVFWMGSLCTKELTSWNSSASEMTKVTFLSSDFFSDTRWYEFWSSKLCEGDLITCRICIPNEFWSTCEALHIIGLFSDHVFKMKFDPLSNSRQNEFCSTFVPMIASKIKSGSKFILAAIWKWIKLHFKHVIRKQPNNMLYLASGSKFIWYAYPTREKVSFT